MGRLMSSQISLKSPSQTEDLDAVVLPVADHDVVAVDQKTVGQVELIGRFIAGLAP